MKYFVVFILFCFTAPVYLMRDDFIVDMIDLFDFFEVPMREHEIEEFRRFESLFRAINTNDIETLKTILKSHEDVLNETRTYVTHLSEFAAKEGSLDVMKYLVAEHTLVVDEDYSIYKSLIPLYEAVIAGKLEAAKRLIELGADNNITFRIYGNTLLHEAATGYSVEILKFLLSFFNIDERNVFGQTPAYLAARTGKPVALHFLLQNGADPYARDKYGDTLIHAAVRSGQVDVVRELTPYKQLINVSNEDNNLPIEIISNMQIVKELVNAGSIITDKSIYNYLKLKKFDIVKYLVVESGNVNARETSSLLPWTDCRDSLLMTLLSKKILYYDMIKFILDRGADVNIKNCDNITALHFVANYENEHTLEIIKLLLDKGADVNSPDSDGFTPLDYARREGNHAVFEYLRTFGAFTRDSMVSGVEFLSTTEDDKSMLNSLGITTEDDKSMLNSLGITTEDDKSMLNSLGTTTEDDKSMLNSLGITTEDDKSMLNSLGTTTEDDKSMLNSLGVTTEDDKSMLNSLGTTTEDDKSIVYSLVRTSDDDNSTFHFLDITTG